ncbi:lysine N(6)-hydroxylase/L-ornithine N(5)-oxygenase family protein [Actinosynnema sp. CS-041913]|uniref:lysine N(6)-hydroxylase/L-ornithine N(5)-oxygenase family protein n=1 Tax=Actinosynnema sp. CS-041913 TaxID=3239917 RepID=UPI003D92E5DE
MGNNPVGADGTHLSAADEPARHYRCVGIGVGPANLSLASLLHGKDDVPNLFLERKEQFTWHDGQQIPGASLQVSLFKDLVTLADPTNSFSFLSYLHDRGRIYHFINAQFGAVPRREFRDYLRWASERNENIAFGEEVRSVGFTDRFVVRTTKRTVTADHVVIGVGNGPWVPEQARSLLGPTQFHVSEYVERARDLGGARVAVVGGGQSGAEAFLDLLARPDGERPGRITWISRRRNYLPIDDSPFSNDYFTPGYSDHFFGLDRSEREAFTAEQVLLSDGISLDTVREIYQRIYLRRFVHADEDQVVLWPDRAVTGVARAGDGAGWELTVRPNGAARPAERTTVDVVVWATGFRPAGLDFLAPIADRLEREGAEFKLDHNFAVVWDGPPEHHVFVQNGARVQRGLADPNLSLIAWRSQRIADRIRGVKSDDQFESFIRWSSPPVTEDLR